MDSTIEELEARNADLTNELIRLENMIISSNADGGFSPHVRNPFGAGRKPKFTTEKIEQVKELASEKKTCREIARITGVSKTSVASIIKKSRLKHDSFHV
jgi:hypothetical protein